MSKLLINGGKCLKGTISISGSKNAALPVLAACILTDESCVISNVPRLSDTENMLELLSCAGAVVQQHANTVELKCDSFNSCMASCELSARLRASFLFFGPALAKAGKAKVYLPLFYC